MIFLNHYHPKPHFYFYNSPFFPSFFPFSLTDSIALISKWVVEKTNQGMRYWFKNIFKNNSSKIVYLQKGKQFLNILLNKIIFWNHKIPRIYHIQNFKIFLKLENNIISSQLLPIESFKSMVVEFSKVI